MFSGVQTEDYQAGGFIHVTEPSSHPCLPHQWIAFGDRAPVDSVHSEICAETL